nr:hypothetical protein [Enterococcus faecium]
MVLFPQRQAFDSHYEQGDVTQILSHLLFLSLDQKILALCQMMLVKRNLRIIGDQVDQFLLIFFS